MDSHITTVGGGGEGVEGGGETHFVWRIGGLNLWHIIDSSALIN